MVIEEIKLDDHQRWQGSYNGINFQIAKWKRTFKDSNLDEGYHWNYYIFINPRSKITYQYKNEISNVDYVKMYPDVNMHYGITYWSRHTNSYGMREVDEIGCDYGHYGDMNECTGKYIDKDVKEIMQDVKKTIDTLPKDLFFTK